MLATPVATISERVPDSSSAALASGSRPITSGNHSVR
jgi:hypothetical protein